MFRPRTFVWLLGLASLVGTAAGAGWILNHAETSPSTSAPASPPAEPASLGIVAFGYMDIESGVAPLYPALPGRVVWRIDPETEGKEVPKNTVLVRLDDRLARADLKRAESDLQNARLQLAKAELLPAQQKEKIEQLRAGLEALQHDKEAAEEQLAIQQRLFDDKSTSKSILRIHQELAHKAAATVRATQSKLRELQLYQPQLDVDRAKAEVGEKEALLDKARLAVDECILKAPVDGTVLRVLVSVGEMLGAAPRAPAVQFCPKDARRVIRAEVQQEWAARVKKGQEAYIEDDTSAGTQWRGKVMRVSDWYTHRRHILQEPFQYNDVRTIECLVELAPSSEPLRIGQRVRVTIKQGGP